MISQWQLKDSIQLRDNLKPLLNSSKGLDIVVLLGATGAGKSTVINFVNNTELFVNSSQEVELKDPTDSSAMKIGLSGKSETLLPKSAKIGQLTFYDLPGLFDNRGVASNLINASLIKNILESAKTVRLVFVVGEDQITASRGGSFKKLLDVSANMLPGSSAIDDSSMFIVTKSLKTNSNQLIEYLKKKIDCQEKMNIWLNPDRIQPMSRMIDAQQRNDTLQKIQDTVPCEIANVNIESLYNTELKNDLKKIFEVEMQSSLEKIYNNYPKNQQTIQLINQSMQYFFNSFEKDIIKDLSTSIIIQLLKPQSESIYQEEINRLIIIINEKKSLTISQLQYTKNKLEQEEQSKQAAELQRQNQRQIEKQRQDQIQLEEDQRRQRVYQAQLDQQAQARIDLQRQVQLKQIEDDRLKKEQDDERYRQLQAELKRSIQADLEQKELIRHQNEMAEKKQREQQAQYEQIKQEQIKQELKRIQENEMAAKRQRDLQAQQDQINQELKRQQEENERNKPENWPREVQSQTNYEVGWDEHYGQWIEMKGFFNNGYRRRVYEKQIEYTIVSERLVRVKPNTGQIYVVEDWKEVSESGEYTGKIRLIRIDYE